MYDPVYSANIGLAGFICRDLNCRKLCKTQRGIKQHCWRVHGLKAQQDLFTAGQLSGQSVQLESRASEAAATTSSDCVKDAGPIALFEPVAEHIYNSYMFGRSTGICPICHNEEPMSGEEYDIHYERRHT